MNHYANNKPFALLTSLMAAFGLNTAGQKEWNRITFRQDVGRPPKTQEQKELNKRRRQKRRALILKRGWA